MTVRSTKTEHCEGDGVRVCPIFPELLPYLRDAFEEAEEGEKFVISRYRQTNVNLRTQLLRIIRQAGLKPWPKLFQNLRATRQTELCQKFPEHVVCDWIGNSPSVAREHYLRTTDEHFERAIRSDEVTSEAAQNPTQQMSELPRKASHTVCEYAKFDIKRAPARQCKAPVGRVGFEQPPLTPSKSPISTEGGAKSDARNAPNSAHDPDLAKIVTVWPELPEHIKAAIKALVQTHNVKSG